MKITSKYNKNSNFSYTLGAFPTIEMLINKPKQVQTIYLHSKLSEKILDQIRKYTENHSISSIETNDRFINKLSPKENCYVMGVFEKFDQILEKNNNHIVLINPANNGNMGTITRCMLGFGFKNLAVITPAVDIFNPEVIRASMGAIFHIKFQYFQDIQEYIAKFPTQHLYTFAKQGDAKLENLKSQEPSSLIFGNESTGLTDEHVQLGNSVRIAQTQKIDSLNLAISCGIAMHHFFQQF